MIVDYKTSAGPDANETIGVMDRVLAYHLHLIGRELPRQVIANQLEAA